MWFEDQYQTISPENTIRKWMLPMEKKYVTKQIDYTFVSNRWRTSVKNSCVRWGPSIHRTCNKDGPADHTLVVCEWKWRIHNVKETTSIDYSVLTDTLNPGEGSDSPRQAFNTEFNRLFKEQVTVKIVNDPE